MDQQSKIQDNILSRYAAGPGLVQSAILGLSDAQLDLSLSAESWSIRQLVHHIVDGDYLWKEFLLRAAGEPEREFSLEWYWCLPQDEWVKRWSYAGREIEHSLALFSANRLHTLELLRRVPDLWAKCLLIPTPQGGQERASVGEVLEMQTRHVKGHVEDIRQIRMAHGV
ncbi:MAG: DinB family protein [Anaerolineales bacterium]